MATELKEGVYWVGVVDWELRHFHGHELSTHRGSAYNSYLIVDEKVALIDTVWTPFREQLIQNIREIIDPAKIDIIVINHAEVDHAGGLPEVIRHAPNATLVVSKRGAETVPGHFHQGWDLKPVGTGDRISLGKNELVFIEAPMLHWPDSMFTYLTGHNILMSNDAFGQHYATAMRFNDQVNQEELYEEALKYFVNIITPYSGFVIKKIDELLAMDIPIDIIASSHGVIWRSEPIQIVKKYQQWAAQEPEPTAVILYDSMWHATRRMAEAIGDGLLAGGVEHKILNVGIADRNDALVDVFNSRAVLVGSSTVNNGLLPSMWPILSEMKGLKLKNKLGAAFGSYGWSGEGVKIIEQHFADCKIPVIREGIRCKWQPAADDLDACRAFGREIAEAVLKA